MQQTKISGCYDAQRTKGTGYPIDHRFVISSFRFSEMFRLARNCPMTPDFSFDFGPSFAEAVAEDEGCTLDK